MCGSVYSILRFAVGVAVWFYCTPVSTQVPGMMD